MRDLGGDHRWMSLNTATVRKQGSLLDIIEACARHDIRAIDPWRDQVAATGIERAAKAIRNAGLALSGYCRGGMFTADASHRVEARDDNRRAVDEAKTLGSPCLVLVAGGLPSIPDRAVRRARTSPPPMRRSRTASRSFSNMPARPQCRWRSSRCIR